MDGETGSGDWPLKGLSGVTGNCHAPFLGEGVAVRPLPYPASFRTPSPTAMSARRSWLSLGN